MQEPFRILLVEDNKDDVELLQLQLNKLDLEFKLDVVDQKDVFLEYLENQSLDAIICDYNLPDFTGIEVLESVRKHKKELPFILVSGYIGEEKAVDAMRKGATDYVLKDNLERLGPVVKREIVHFREYKKTEEERDKAIRDLRERVKEQKCLYNISSLDDQKLTIPELLEQAVKKLPDGFQYPEIAEASIEYASKTYQTKNFIKTSQSISESTDDIENGPLVVTVTYLQTDQKLKDDSFLDEEEYLLTSIVKNISLKINRIQNQKELKEKQELLERAYNLAEIGNWELNIEKSTLYWSPTVKEIHEVPEDYEPDLDKTLDFYKVSYENDSNLLLKEINKAVREGGTFDEEIKILTAKNNERWIRVVGEPEFVNGKCVRLFGSMQNIDNRKRAEEELYKSEQRFRSLVQEGLEMIAIVDEGVNYKYVAPTKERFQEMGKEPDDLIGKNALELFHPNDRERLFKNIRELEPNESKSVKPFRYKNKNGEWRWMESTITNLTQNSAINGYVTNSRDVTERIQQERKLRDIVENSTNLFYRHDVNHVITYISPQSREFLGCSPEEAKKRWIEFATDHPANEEGYQKTIKAIESGVAQKPYELQLQKVNGEIIWVEVNEAPIVENGETIAMVGSLTDITARKKYEEELEQLSMVASKTTDIIIITDAEERITWVNNAYEDLTGYTLQECVGRIPGDFLQGPETDPETVKRLAIAIDNEKSIQETILNYSKEGRKYWLDMKIDPIVEDGECRGFIAIERDVTEQKIHEQKLEELSLVAAKTTDIIIMTDANDKITWVNKAFESKLGYSLVECIGKSPGIILRGESTDKRTAKQIQEGKKEKKSIHEVILNYTKDGRQVWLDVTADPIFDDYGEFKGYIAIDKDVTGQIKQRKKLQESVERYDIVTKATSDTIWDADLKTDTVNYNSNIYDVFGYTSSEVQNSGDWWLNNIHPEDRERVDKEFKKAELAGTDRIQSEYRFKCSDGSYKFVNDRAFIINDEDGNPVRMIGAMQDVTKQKEENMWLKLLESAIANTNESIAILEGKKPDGKGRKILYVNNAFEEMTGFKKNEVLHESLLKLMGPTTDQRTVAKLIHSLDNGKPTQTEVSYFDKFGNEKWAHISFAPVLDLNNEFSHWICIGRDISERRERERELRESLQEKETLLMEIHHRVKNNLAVVSSMMQLQAMDESDESLQAKLYDSVARIRSMVTIHELLYESGSFSKIDFSENLRKLISMIINTIHNEREISINFDCEQVQLNVNQAIPSSLIVNEIITNSIKHAFTGSKDGVINVELKEVNELIKIKLTDNGKGLPEDLGKKEKSSLGLQLIDVLSKQMNATYNYDSTPGGGTSFTIEFEKSAVKGIGNAYLV